MQTNFSIAQLADPAVQDVDAILRKCVHCGFCTATCPTYVLLGDELDSPRGRIYLIKDLIEKDKPATAKVAKHIDRCLSCLSCMTTCPSGVNYMHLVDRARERVEATYRRPWTERFLRALLARVMSDRGLFRWAMRGARLGRPLRALAPGRLKGMLALAPARLPRPSEVDRPQVFKAEGPRKARVALLSGCVQPVLAPAINEATVRLLTRHGCEVVVARGATCCGSLVYHMGRAGTAREQAGAAIEAWSREIDGEGLDALVINASGCGTTIKDYGHMFRDDPAIADKAARVAALAKDVTEFMTELGLGKVTAETGQRVAYHSACSMQHGQQIREQPKALLAAAGFEVRDVPEGHLCCGSAGTYNMLQPDLAAQLLARKVANIEATEPDIIAAGNLGCMVQIARGIGVPAVHTVELLDWATGGPEPAALARR